MKEFNLDPSKYTNEDGSINMEKLRQEALIIFEQLYGCSIDDYVKDNMKFDVFEVGSNKDNANPP